MKSAITSLLSCSAAILAVSTSTPVLGQTKVLFSSFAPPTQHMNQRVFPAYFKDLEAATNGRVRIEVSPNSLAPPPGQLDLVLKGGADLAWQNSGVVPNRLAMNQMTQVPSPTASAEVMTRSIWRTHEKFFGPAGEYKGLKLIALFMFPANYLFMVKDPLNSLDQIKQMKILTNPGETARAWGNLTSGVVASPVVRYFDLVSKGSVDAYTSMPVAELIGLNLSKYTKYVVDLKDAKNAATFALVMNEAKWNSISPADQAAIEKISGEAFAKYMKGADDANEEVAKKVAADGLQFVTAPDAVIDGVKRAFASSETDWIAEAKKRGVDGRAALDFYRAQIRAAVK